MKTKEKVKPIVLQGIKVETINVPLRGKTSLIMDRMSKETKDDILIKQTGGAKGNKKKIRDTKEEIQQAIHVTCSGTIGFPSFGFKKGMMEATSFVGDRAFSKKLISGIKIVNAEDGLIPIKFKKQTVIEHSIGPQTKFNPIFHDWSCDLEIQYDANNVSAQDIVTLLNYAGFYNGIGSWRPKGGGGGSGEYGMYEVVTK